MKENEPEPQRVYHIAEPEPWREAARTGMYTTPSLESEGFIHCSFAHQLERSLAKFFADAEMVTILEIDPLLLQSELRFEPSDDDTFPHIYGELNVDAVVSATIVERDKQGRLVFSAR